MLYDKFRKMAAKGEKSICPCCDTTLIAKCGHVMIHHWAHENKEKCDDWWEPMSKWHQDWQLAFKPEYREIICDQHIADLKFKDGFVLELQHSPISIDDVWAREEHYGNMAWVFDAAKFGENFMKTMKEPHGDGSRFTSFYWKRGRGYISACEKPLYFDFGETGVLEVRKFEQPYEGSNSSKGWGFMWDKDEIISHFDLHNAPQIKWGQYKKENEAFNK